MSAAEASPSLRRSLSKERETYGSLSTSLPALSARKTEAVSRATAATRTSAATSGARTPPVSTKNRRRKASTTASAREKQKVKRIYGTPSASSGLLLPRQPHEGWTGENLLLPLSGFDNIIYRLVLPAIARSAAVAALAPQSQRLT